MNLENIDEAERLINESKKLEAQIKKFNEILESPCKLTLGYVDYGHYNFFNQGLLTYQLDMEEWDIEALIETRNHKIADIKKRLGEL